MEPSDSICKQARACQDLFNQCIGLPLEEELDWLENWRGTFNLWIASLKATSVGRSSLDYRVRDLEEVREVLLGLLDGLFESLECIITAQSDNAGTLESEGDEDSGGSSPFLSEDDDSEQDSLYGIKKMNSRFFEYMYNIKTIVAQLGRIGTAIRQSGAKYRYQKADESLKEENFDDFKRYLTVIVLRGSISLNRESPDNAAVFQSKIFDPARLTTVQKRLIQANITRRNRIEYATRYMLPMEEQPTEKPNLIREIVAPRMGSVTGRSSVVRKENFAMTKAAKPKAASTAAPSLSRTATKIGSQFSFSMEMSKKSTPSAITRVTQTGNALDYPRCPKQKSDKDPLIKCPYCANLLSGDYSKSQSRWSGHVAQDILPYTCIYELCGTPDAMYLNSSELFQHIRNEHSVARWVCDHCASRIRQDSFIFETQKQWETHMKQIHSGSVLSTKLPSLARASQRKIPEQTSCPLCAYEAETREPSLDNHILEHIHQFALECLPWGTGEEDKNSTSAGGPVSRKSTDTDGEIDIFVDHDFFDTESPDDISSRLSNIFRFFDESYRVSKTEEHASRLNSTVDRCNQLYNAGDLSPPTLETISSVIRKVLLLMRQRSWQGTILPQILLGDGGLDNSKQMESRSSTNIANVYQGMIEQELDLLDDALSKDYQYLPTQSELRSTDSSKHKSSKESQITEEISQKHREDTLSTTDSITEYLMENGRKYLKYPEGARYPYPIDDLEMDRLDMQHHMFKLVNKGRLFLAPIKGPKRILDIGTGSGMWPLEMASLFPDAEITGTDLFPVPLTKFSENVHFLIDDATKDDRLWDLGYFDYVHISHLSGIPSYEDLLRKAMRHLRPGCYIECHELDFKPKCDDETMPPASLHDGFSEFVLNDWVDLQIKSALTADTQRQVRVAHLIQRWMRDLGFVDIKQRVSKIPLNTWPTDPHLKEIGTWNLSNFSEGLSGWSYKPFVALGWSKPEIDNFLVDVKKCIENCDVHCYMDYYVVIGRKPLPTEQQNSF